jgi:hypothetical protein
MSALGQKQTCALHQPMSALPPKATSIGSTQRFNEFPKFNRFLGTSAMPVITVSLTLWGTTTSTVHTADLPTADRRRTATLSSSL